MMYDMIYNMMYDVIYDRIYDINDVASFYNAIIYVLYYLCCFD